MFCLFKKIKVCAVTGVALLGIGMPLNAANAVKNGTFDEGGKEWDIRNDKIISFVQVGENTVLKFSTNTPAWNRCSQNIQLKPSTKYRISYRMKGTDIKGKDPVRSGGSLQLSCDKSFMVWGKAFWREANGTFDWTRKEFTFDSSKFPPGKPVLLQLCFSGCSGEFFMDDIVIEPVPEKEKFFGLEIFPHNIIDPKEYEVSAGQYAFIGISTHGQAASPGDIGYLTMDVPDFMELLRVCEEFPIFRDGRQTRKFHSIKSQKITRNNQAYTRYTVEFDKFFTRFYGQGWFNQKGGFRIASDSAGKSGKVYWSFKIGSRIQPERSFSVRVTPALELPEKPASQFRIGIFSAGGKVTALPEALNFWRALSRKVSMVEGYHGLYENVPGFEKIIFLHGNDLHFHLSSDKLQALRKKMPPDLDARGQKLSRGWISIRSKVEDKDGYFESYLVDALRTLKAEQKDFCGLMWDFEPHANGYDLRNRQCFAGEYKLTHVPTPKEINEKYAAKWFQFTVKLHADFIRKVAKIVHRELPGKQFMLCSDNLHADPPHVAGWCGVDVSLNDDDVDIHADMPYYCGVKFFDDIAYNIKMLKKPVFPLMAPTIRSKMWFEKYTPPQLKQNIVALAALKAAGFAIYPDDTMPSEYFRGIADAMSLVSRYERIYLTGKRCDRDFSIEPQNSITRRISGVDGKPHIISWPEFPLRWTVHQEDGKYFFTVFNYHSANPVIVKISGKNVKPFLLEIAPDDVMVVSSAQPPQQALLQKKLVQFKNLEKADIFKEKESGKCRIGWSASRSGKPLRTLTNGRISAGIDAFGSGEVLSFHNENGKDLLEQGLAGRIVLLDKRQIPPPFRMVNCDIDNGVPFAISEAVIPSFGGANPEINPLMGMKITRKIELKDDRIICVATFSNPTKETMNFQFRTTDYPMLAASYKQRKIATSELNAGEDGRNKVALFYFRALKKGVKVPFGENLTTILWKGNPIVQTAVAGDVVEKFVVSPGPGFAGWVSWRDHQKPAQATIELLSEPVVLVPGGVRTFHWEIK